MFGSSKEEKDLNKETVQKDEQQQEEQVDATGENFCTDELASVKDQLVRLGADFQNYKKRTEKDKANWGHLIQADLFNELLPIIDDFDRALDQAQKEEKTEEFTEWLKGFSLIHKSLYDFLKKQKVEPIEEVTTFDPELHEALVQVDSDEHESGAIVDVMQRGFLLNGKVIRPAKVSVAK